jgi:hypothetical protein
MTILFRSCALFVASLLLAAPIPAVAPLESIKCFDVVHSADGSHHHSIVQHAECGVADSYR